MWTWVFLDTRRYAGVRSKLKKCHSTTAARLLLLSEKHGIELRSADFHIGSTLYGLRGLEMMPIDLVRSLLHNARLRWIVGWNVRRLLTCYVIAPVTIMYHIHREGYHLTDSKYHTGESQRAQYGISVTAGG